MLVRRGSRSVDGQDQGQRRPRDLESPRRSRWSSGALQHLRRWSDLPRVPLRPAEEVQDLRSYRHDGGTASHRVLGAQVWRGRDGRLQVRLQSLGVSFGTDDGRRSLRPLFLSVVPGNEKQLDKLRTMRATLQHDISVVVNEFGPQLFEDFRETRIIPPTSVPPPVMPTMSRRRSTYGQGGQGTFFNHPLSAFVLSPRRGEELTFVQAGSTSTFLAGLRKRK